MKFANFLILSILFLSLPNTHGQIPYYDALELRKLANSSGQLNVDQQVYDILDKYYEPDVSNSTNDIDDAFEPAGPGVDPNPFINLSGGARSGISPNGVPNIISNMGGIDVTNITDGLAKFLVERTKKELSIAFFEQFKEDLATIDELRVLFPKTHTLLMAIDDEIYNFSGYINMLRETFQEDLQNSISNLRKFMVEVNSMKEYLDRNPTLGFILYNSLLIAEQLQNGVHPGDVLSTLKNEGLYTNGIKNFDPSVATLDLFSQSLRSKQKDRYWVSSDSLKLIFKDKATFKIFLGLIYQQAKVQKIEYLKNDGDTINMTAIMENLYSHYLTNEGPIKFYIQGIMSKASIIDLRYKAIKQKKAESEADYNDYYAFYTSSLDFMEHISAINEIPVFRDNIDYDSDNLEKYFEVAYTAGDLYLDVNEKRYFGAVLNLNVIIEQVVPDANLQAGSDTTGRFYAKKVLPKILKYGNLAASLAEAESSDGVQAIIEAVALPAGSSSIKRRAEITYSLNAYVGLSGGTAYNTQSKNWAFETGVIAPIGPEISWGHDKYDSKGGVEKKPSFSVFVPLVDIGAVTTFRFGDSETEEVPTITLENIFSPGLYLISGFRDKPISFGIGCQATPRLHKVTVDGNETNGNANLAIEAFIAVDIPLLNLKSTPKTEN